MAGPKDPTVPPPRRRLESKPRVEREDEIDVEVEPISSDPRELMLRKLKDVQDQSKAELHDAESRAKDGIAELAEVFERKITELRVELREKDATIATLRRGDTSLNEAVEQLRAANLQLREEMAVTITSAVTAEVSKRTKDTTAAQIQGAGRMTQVKSTALAIIAALVSSGALVQIAQSCGEKPASTVPTPAPGPGYGGRL